VRFNLISNLTNGCGLQQDYVLFRRELEARGHQVQGIQFNAPRAIRADVNVFLEVVTPALFKCAPVQWAVPNPEWWFADWHKYEWHRVLAKTRDCERLFRAKVGDRCQYIGWLSRDLYQPVIPRERKFLHVAGKSQFKNTDAVVMACHHARVPLTLIGEHVVPKRRVSDVELSSLMNSHFCHVMPSAYEGYGQVLHEAQGVGQVIITTDAPPMNELTPAVLVPPVSTSKHHDGTLHKVSATGVAQAIKQVMEMSDAEVLYYGEQGRAQYLKERGQFSEALDALVGRKP
jgi:hypothetical protein